MRAGVSLLSGFIYLYFSLFLLFSVIYCYALSPLFSFAILLWLWSWWIKLRLRSTWLLCLLPPDDFTRNLRLFGEILQSRFACIFHVFYANCLISYLVLLVSKYPIYTGISDWCSFLSIQIYTRDLPIATKQHNTPLPLLHLIFTFARATLSPSYCTSLSLSFYFSFLFLFFWLFLLSLVPIPLFILSWVHLGEQWKLLVCRLWSDAPCLVQRTRTRLWQRRIQTKWRG